MLTKLAFHHEPCGAVDFVFIAESSGKSVLVNRVVKEGAKALKYSKKHDCEEQIGEEVPVFDPLVINVVLDSFGFVIVKS